MSAPRTSTLTRIGNNLGPLTLLSVLTSVAFNRAILARERTEQRRLHHLQLSLLHQISKEASTTSSLSSSSLLYSLDEQKKLARRLRTLQLDPIRLGFSKEVLPSPEEDGKLRRAREASTSWGSALFGSGVVAKMKEAMGKASSAVREQGIGFGRATDTSKEDEADEEWLRALEASLANPSERISEQSKAMHMPTREASPVVSLREQDGDDNMSGNGWSLSSVSSLPSDSSKASRQSTNTSTERRRVYM